LSSFIFGIWVRIEEGGESVGVRSEQKNQHRTEKGSTGKGREPGKQEDKRRGGGKIYFQTTRGQDQKNKALSQTPSSFFRTTFPTQLKRQVLSLDYCWTQRESISRIFLTYMNEKELNSGLAFSISFSTNTRFNLSQLPSSSPSFYLDNPQHTRLTPPRLFLI